MNRQQWIALMIAAANLLVILLFPPFDQYSIANAKVPTFAGFHFAFAPPPHAQINTSVLWLEVMALTINASISWLLLRESPATTQSRLKVRFQNASLILTGINLVLILLFPPFESVFALTNAVLPTFEGFYFIFNQKPSHIIVVPLLYLEVMIILVNGALFWLIFKERGSGDLSPAELRALASRVRSK